MVCGFVLIWREHAEAAVCSDRVVEVLDVVEDPETRLGAAISVNVSGEKCQRTL
jgi:hypothetical protein